MQSRLGTSPPWGDFASPKSTPLKRRMEWDTTPRAGCCEVAAGYRGGNVLKAGG